MERVHQELQKLMGILVRDVVRCHPVEWPELLPALELLINDIPGPHGYTQRDLDRRWSVAFPLEKDLQPSQVAEFEPLSEWAGALFQGYRELRAGVQRRPQEASDKRTASEAFSYSQGGGGWFARGLSFISH